MRSRLKTTSSYEPIIRAILRKKPHPFQKKIIEKGVKELSVNDRTTIVMPCGSGKTLVALWIAERIRAKTVVVFAPTLGLLAQSAREFLTNTRHRNVACLAICSDSYVVEGLDEIRPSPEEAPFAVTGEVGVVHAFLENNVLDKFLFCTYQSADVLGTVLTRSQKMLDIAIFDEAHRTAGKFEAPFTFALLNENLPVRKRLFLTATLRVYFMSDASKAYSMDNASSYGRICAQMTFSEAVKMGIICPYQVILSVVNTTSLPLETLDAGVVTEEDIEAREAAIRENLIQTVGQYGARKVITYHSTIERAERFVSIVLKDALPDYEKLHVSSIMSGKARNEAMERFRNSELAIISNARCLTEGIDVPAADLVVFADPKQSWIDIVQAIGRVMRVSVEKKTGYVFLPLFVDQNMGESIDEALARCHYEPVWQVLQALCAIDQEMEWDAALYERGIWESTQSPPIVNILIPPGVNAEVIRKSVGLFLVSNLTDIWEKHYDKLLRYKQEHGNIDVPFDSPAYSELRSWLNTQIARWKLLTYKRKKLLLDLGFDYTSRLASWWEKLEQVRAFKVEYDHLPPYRSVLGKWVAKQRMFWNVLSSEQHEALLKLGFVLVPRWAQWQNNYEQTLSLFKEHASLDSLPKYLRAWLKDQRQRWDVLSPEKRDALQKFGFDPRPAETNWKKRLEEFRDYVKKHGHCVVRKNENPSLWSCSRELIQSMKEGKLSPKKIAELDELNFVWGNALERYFEETYHMLAVYREQHGRMPPTTTRAHLGKYMRLLANRISMLRRWYRAGKLTDKQTQRLLELGFSFTPDEDRWHKKFHELERYVADGNNPNAIPHIHPLRNWVRSMRRSYESGIMSSEKIMLMEALGVKWENPGIKNEIIKNERWENNYRIIEKYFKENKRTMTSEGNVLPVSHRLYEWWKNQIFDYYILPPDRAEKIRSLKPVKLRGRWSVAEKEIVRQNPDKSVEELEEILIGRNSEAIQKLRSRYGWG